MTSTQTDTSNMFYTGRVKWFNNKKGYGFITIISLPECNNASLNINDDVFVHHSAISVSKEQYKYLVQGEYVHFTLKSNNDDTAHKYSVCSISGIEGGALLCETRNDVNTNMVRKSKHHNIKSPSTSNSTIVESSVV